MSAMAEPGRASGMMCRPPRFLGGTAVKSLVEMLATLEVHPARMKANLDSTRGFPFSEAVMLTLAARAGKQTAHRLVTEAARDARDKDISFQDAVMGHQGIRSHLSEPELEAAFSIERGVWAMRRNGRPVARAIGRWRSGAIRMTAEDVWTRLDALPRRQLTVLPTPLVEAPKLSGVLGGPPLWIKRDDLISFAFGGNKVRGLELMLADAEQRGCDVLVSGAGPQSNHVRATATRRSAERDEDGRGPVGGTSPRRGPRQPSADAATGIGSSLHGEPRPRFGGPGDRAGGKGTRTHRTPTLSDPERGSLWPWSPWARFGSAGAL